MIEESRTRLPRLAYLVVPLAGLLRLAVFAALLAAVAVPLLWLDYAAHAERHRILVEYLHPEHNEATVDGIEEPQPAPIHRSQVGAVAIAVTHGDRRVKLGLDTLFGDNRARIAGELRTRCYYDAKLVAYDDLWSERLLRSFERRRSAVNNEGMDTRRPLAVVEATLAYCDPNGLTRRERRERDRPQTAGQWLDLLTRQPGQRPPSN